jgi:hypothetical protein
MKKFCFLDRGPDRVIHRHGRMARGGHGLPKFHSGPPFPALPFYTLRSSHPLWPFQGWLTRRAGGLQLSSTLLDTPRRRPMFTDGLLKSSLDDFGEISDGMNDFRQGVGFGRHRGDEANHLRHHLWGEGLVDVRICSAKFSKNHRSKLDLN